jgi:hypothetical protein
MADDRDRMDSDEVGRMKDDDQVIGQSDDEEFEDEDLDVDEDDAVNEKE